MIINFNLCQDVSLTSEGPCARACATGTSLSGFTEGKNCIGMVELSLIIGELLA